MTTDITELAQRADRIISETKLKHGGNDTYAPIMKWDEFLALVEALEKAQQRIAKLESRAVKPPDELSGETLLDVASRTDLVYSDDTGILEYTNINECVVKVTAPPDKVIRFRCRNKRICMRLVDRVKTHEHAGIIVDFPKNYKDFIQ
ncbi:TPA: hypothetical protein ACXPXP_002043 [Klebsiella pneumoniae]